MIKRFSEASNEPQKPAAKIVAKKGEYDPLKPKARVAHAPANGGTSIPLTVVPIPNCPVPSVIRHRQLNGFYRALLQTVHPGGDEKMSKKLKFQKNIMTLFFRCRFFSNSSSQTIAARNII